MIGAVLFLSANPIALQAGKSLTAIRVSVVVLKRNREFLLLFVYFLFTQPPYLMHYHKLFNFN
jgi:hypothetical protein